MPRGYMYVVQHRTAERWVTRPDSVPLGTKEASSLLAMLARLNPGVQHRLATCTRSGSPVQ